jgi:ATPase subunit of ABC transporter with duplicated ATPase domains
MLTLHNVRYAHPNKDVLLESICCSISKYDKIALVGNNGSGKSTLLQLMAGRLQPAAGTITTDTPPYYIPQHFGQFDQLSVAAALGVDVKLRALQEILAGDVSERNMTLLDDDWGIEERCTEALAHWQLQDLALSQPMATLSGGQKTRVFLAGIAIHKPGLVLLDEPSNHLDAAAREVLYAYIQNTSDTLLVVSHDRSLLNLVNTVWELGKQGISSYGGNYEFYAAQKQLALQALANELNEKEKALRKAKEVQRAAIERQQKLDARGKKKQEQSGLPTISMNTLRNNAEKSTAKTKEVHAAKTAALALERDELRQELPARDKMKLWFGQTELHSGKLLFQAKQLNFGYPGQQRLWEQPLSFEIYSGARLAIKGNNGSGKSTLMQLLQGRLEPQQGTMYRAELRTVYIDQDYTLINNAVSVYQQAEACNTAKLPEHELKSRLTHFLFGKAQWDKPCAALSGGERMRLSLCCISLGAQAPELILLDEPTNNLDLQNMELLTAALADYKGTLITIAHDAVFLEQLGIDQEIRL